MNILICGDVVGKSGREAIVNKIPELRQNLKIDFVIVNGENSASGFGITGKICQVFYDNGVDVITSGNHVWDQKEIVSHIEKDKRLLRPSNYPNTTPGRSYGIYKSNSGSNIAVINVMCRLFMDPLDDPFNSLENILEEIKISFDNIITIVDVHGEATSEKMAIGHFLDGKVTAVVGTHTHVPTADLQILENGTFFQTDLGMCGDYNSVVGMNKSISITKFRNKHIKIRHSPAEGEASLCGVLLEVDVKKSKVKSFKQIIIGGRLRN